MTPPHAHREPPLLLDVAVLLLGFLAVFLWLAVAR